VSKSGYLKVKLWNTIPQEEIKELVKLKKILQVLEIEHKVIGEKDASTQANKVSQTT
jgi:hypothetical protein